MWTDGSVIEDTPAILSFANKRLTQQLFPLGKTLLRRKTNIVCLIILKEDRALARSFVSFLQEPQWNMLQQEQRTMTHRPRISKDGDEFKTP